VLVLAAFPTLASADVPALDSVSVPTATTAAGLDSLLPPSSLPERHWWGGGSSWWGGWGGWPWWAGMPIWQISAQTGFAWPWYGWGWPWWGSWGGGWPWWGGWGGW